MLNLFQDLESFDMKKPKPFLHNRLSKEELKALREAESFARRTISFYRYVNIEQPEKLRDELFLKWSEFGCLGRIYIAKEGINAQMNVPEPHWEAFVAHLYGYDYFREVPFKVAVEEPGHSFYKLTIKVKHKIVADGLDDESFDPSNTGDYVTAREMNQAIEEGATIVDMRNHYESEIGHFEKAICPDADTFKEELPKVLEDLKGKENEKVVMYCTGGIRCEKASAFLKHHGFKRVYHLKGGIIDYAHQVEAEGLESKFRGKNFVFDNRVGERITPDVISECHQCGEKCDRHVNCGNHACHLLFIQCEKCEQRLDGQYCCTKCHDFDHLPEAEKRALRKGPAKDDCLAVYKSRLRPNLKDMKQ
ncbi:MAG TPA: rhodanese-related sulfurtransferase [Candidatus Gracilibacteria bacterium]